MVEVVRAVAGGAARSGARIRDDARTRGLIRPDPARHPDMRASNHPTKGTIVLRLIRLLPIILPLLTAASRNPNVRQLLHLKPQTARGSGTGTSGRVGSEGSPRRARAVGPGDPRGTAQVTVIAFGP